MGIRSYICGGDAPRAGKDGEMEKCGGVCGEVEKCGTICGGVTKRPEGRDYGKDVEVEKCGNICAAAK